MTHERRGRRVPALSTLAALAIVAGTGCAPYRIISKSGPPSALAGADEIAVAFDYSNIRLGLFAQKTEEEFQEGKDEAEFEGVKDKMDMEFKSGFSEFIVGNGQVRDDATYTVRVVYLFMQQGKFAPPFGQDTVVQAQCVFEQDGKVTDTIETQTQVEASMTRPSIVQRAGVAGRQLGRNCAHYYKKSRK